MAALFIVALETIQMSIDSRIDRYIVLYSLNGLLHRIRKEQIIFV